MKPLVARTWYHGATSGQDLVLWSHYWSGPGIMEPLVARTWYFEATNGQDLVSWRPGVRTCYQHVHLWPGHGTVEATGCPDLVSLRPASPWPDWSPLARVNLLWQL